MKADEPSLFGLRNSNRDFTNKNSWGKNQFNSSFPASLSCYLLSKGMNAVYLSMRDRKLGQYEASIENIFGINLLDSNTYFAFESIYTPFQKYVTGSLPRTDLVIQNYTTGQCVSGIEIKLTALPDNTTCELEDKYYGSEIVVRPDTIVYLACSIANSLGTDLKRIIGKPLSIKDWTEPSRVLAVIDKIVSTVEYISIALQDHQSAFLLQPIWKTDGKSPRLSNNCLDVFVWSNAGFLNFISDIANTDINATRITRQTRTAIWLYKMLIDINNHGRFDHREIIDTLSFNTKNDKAFASAGSVTNKYMSCKRLEKPIIKKNELKNIILNGGQNLLSPERRFDAVIYNSPELF